MKWKLSAPWRIGIAVGALGAVLAASNIPTSIPAWASGIFTNGVCVAGSSGVSTGSPAVTYCNNSNTYPLTGLEQIPADTQLSGGQSPQSEAITTLQLAGYMGAQPVLTNALIGGDATTNLWQRATTSAGVTTTLTYGSADRWAIWSVANDQIKLIQDSTAGDLATGYQYAFKLQRTATTATANGQACMMQVLTSANSYQFAGQNAELVFHMHTGANFAGTVNAYVFYGTGTDQSATSAAFALNAGGGGSGSWTGQTNATVGLLPTIAASTTSRFAVEAAIPTTATQLGVAICYTSTTATALANDYIALSGIQLARNPANLAYASATVGYLANTAGGVPARAFDRRNAQLEASLQYPYYWQVVDPAATVRIGTCQVITANTTANCLITLPTTLRSASPTIGVPSGAGFGLTSATGTADTCTGVAALASGSNANNISVVCTTGATIAITVPSQMIGAAVSGAVISASAEL